MYANAVAKKSRLLDTRKYNYYFTEKEYEQVKQEDDKRLRQFEKKLEEISNQLQETIKRDKKQQLESAARFIKSGIDIAIVSANMNLSVSDIEDYMGGKGLKDMKDTM